MYSVPQLELKYFYNFKTTSDTEVLLIAYKKWGVDCLNKIKGMFSFCIVDIKKNIFFCARDHFGQKPFYYFYDNKNFIFASELRALIKNKLIKKNINYDALLNYFHYDSFVGNETIIDNCFKLEPSHYLIFNLKNNSLVKKKYWETSFQKKEHSKFFEKFENTFKNSLEQHLRSDVPIALYLSGGIDSTSIACMAKKINKHSNITAFNLKFNEKSYDEDNLANYTAKKLNIKIINEEINFDEINIKTQNLINKLDEPLADPGYIAIGLIAEKIYKQNFKVVLSGDGGDELFGGYEPFLKLKLFNLIKKNPFAIKLVNFFSKIIKDDMSYMTLAHKVNIFQKGFLHDDKYYNSRWLCSFLPEEISTLLKKNKIFENFKKENVYSYIDKIIKETDTNNQYDIMLNQYQKHYLNNIICSHTDKANMNFSIEARSPFLDKDLFDLTNSLNNEEKYSSNYSKIILRKFINQFDLKKITTYKKKGFTIPIARLINTSMREKILDSFNTETNILNNIINKNYINNCLSEHLNNKKNNYKKIWNLFVLNEWIENNLVN